MSAILDAALGYVESSPQWPVFPVHPKTKQPLTQHGFKDATTDIDLIRDWHRRGMLNALAIPTGAITKTVVLDFDAKHDGERLLALLEENAGELDKRRSVRTQNGGLHLYFRHPGYPIRCGKGGTSALGRALSGANGADVRADGGYVLVPPSPGYRWNDSEEESLPELPPIWLAILRGSGDPPEKPVRYRSSTALKSWSDSIHGSTIGDGERSNKLYARGAAAHLAGASDADVHSLLVSVNAARCSPPLGAREVARIAASACKATGRRA